MNWIWMAAAVYVVAVGFVWSFIAVCARERDREDAHMLEEIEGSDALGRAVAAARQLPSLAERSLLEVPRLDECVRCFALLEPGRRSICTDCWEGAA